MDLTVASSFQIPSPKRSTLIMLTPGTVAAKIAPRLPELPHVNSLSINLPKREKIK